MLRAGDVEVVVALLDRHAESAEGIGNDAQVAARHVFDRDAVAHHRTDADERADLDHIGQDAVLGAVELGRAHHRKAVGGDARDVGAHAVEQVAELLEIGFAGGVVDGGGAFGQDGSHQDIGRAGHRGFVEQHVGAMQFFGFDLEEFVVVVHTETRTEFLQTEKVRVESASADLVAAGFTDECATEASYERADGENRTAQRRTARQILVGAQIVQVDVVGAEGDVARRIAAHMHADVLQEANEVVDVDNVGHIRQTHFLVGEQRGANHLQRFVLRALRGDFAPKSAIAFDEKRGHVVKGLKGRNQEACNARSTSSVERRPSVQ